MDQPLICRTCAKVQVSGAVFSLNRVSSTEDRHNFRVMLEKCVPGMMLHISKDPMICLPCIDKLKVSYEFIMNCLHVERIIYSFIKNMKNLSPGAVDLCKIFDNAVKKEDPDPNTTSPETSTDVPETLNLVEVKIEDEDVGAAESTKNNIEKESADETDEGSVTREPLENGNRENLKENRDCDNSDDSFIELEMDTNWDDKPSSSTTRRFKCDKCTYKAYNRKLLENHKKKKCKLNITFHFCDRCDFKTSRKNHLNRHMLTHGGKRPYVCQTCGNGYTEKWSYEVHLLKHSGIEKPYKCDKCDASFYRKHDLKMHSVKHDSKYQHEGKYKCEVCGRSYKDKRGLEGHVSLHSGEHKYRCGDCNFGASWKKNLLRHIKAKHSGC